MIRFYSFTFPTLALASAFAWAQPCQTFFVDSNAPSGNFRTAINDLNTTGCTSGGTNTILIDNTKFGDTVINTPLPAVTRPVQIELFVPGSGVRHVIRSNDATQTSIGYALRASARVIINDIEIEGGGGRAFFGGVLLEGDAHNSRVRGVKIENVRSQGIHITGVDGAEVRRSDHNPVEIYNSGWGLNHENPQWEPAILINGTINTVVYGAFLGVRPDGSASGNCTYGIEVRDSLVVQIGHALENTNLRNRIGGNRWGGIRVTGSEIVSIRGNFIGLTPDGGGVAGNGQGTCFGSSSPDLPRGGVVIGNSNHVAVGANEGEGNVIVGNNRGIVIAGGGNINVRHNLIGQRPDGTPDGNITDAVRIESAVDVGGIVRIGGSEAQANVIRGGVAGTHGVHVLPGAGHVIIRSNSIWDHPGSAISRPAPPAAPAITAMDLVTGMVNGTVAPVPSAGEVDVYMDGGSQAREYLGTAPVSAGGSTFSLVVSPAALVLGENLTATYTRHDAPDDGTSALSVPFAISPPVTEYTLTVTRTGEGVVTSIPAGIDCGLSCVDSFESGEIVTLTAVAAGGWTFSGWSGECEPDKSGLACVATVEGDRAVHALFEALSTENLIFEDRFQNQ